MTVSEFYRQFSSDCTASSDNQVLTHFEKPQHAVGRCYYRIAHGGTRYAFLFSNAIDSTFSDGSLSKANDVGHPYTIFGMRVGLCKKTGDEPECFHTLTFDGNTEREVSGAEPFCSDPVMLSARAGDVLCYEITFAGDSYPYHEEIVIPVFRDTGDGFVPDKRVPLPLMIGCDRPVTRRIAFIGDSITQGCGTPVDSYTHWAAKIAGELPETYSVWDIGIGFARGYDAATDKGWLARAKTCDTVNVCFGVNDLLRGRTADEVTGDLRTICRSLRAAGCRVILFTVPPFDMTGESMRYWYEVNRAVRGELSAEADAVFDFAAVLGQPEPNAHMSVYGGHPDVTGCAAAAKAYLAAELYETVFKK